MSHPRITPEGLDLGRLVARLAEQGQQRLAPFKQVDFTTIAPRLRSEMCKSCACRPGSIPNGCLQTQLDLLKSAHEGKPFLCHAPKDGRLCAGWTGARAEIVARPLPAAVVAVLDRWQYSPPDEPDHSEDPEEPDDLCLHCRGDGMDPDCDYLLPCPDCG